MNSKMAEEFNFSFDAYATIFADNEEEARAFLESVLFDTPFYLEINNLNRE